MISRDTCLDCPAAITRQSRTGRCRSCASRIALADPVKAERRLVALRAALATPEAREAKRVARLRTERERADDPTWRAYKQASGRRLRAQYEADEAAQARNRARRADVGRQNRERHLGWCPSDYRDDYQRLRDAVGAVEARRQVELQIERDERARIAALTPLERQLEKLRRGARLVEKPVLRRADPGYTLGGVAPEAM